tara:strand:- start:264 stop:851 length:588 start_codon:yes stop_codon:yes gene_type:complete
MHVESKFLKNNLGKTFFEGPISIIPKAYKDERGFFMESWNESDFLKIIEKKITFVQDNHSFSYKGVLRGLHYQIPPYAQGKLVRCIKGEVFDVAVDIRENSDTFGTWVGINLKSNLNNQIWIPEGFAHGFYTLSKTADVLYKTTNYWAKDFERSLNWNDPLLDIDWPILGNDTLLSKKDAEAPFLNKYSFEYFKK